MTWNTLPLLFTRAPKPHHSTQSNTPGLSYMSSSKIFNLAGIHGVVKIIPE